MAISETSAAASKVQLDEFDQSELVYTVYLYNAAHMSLCANVSLLA